MIYPDGIGCLKQTLRQRQADERARIARLNELGSRLRETFPEAFGTVVPLATRIKEEIVPLVAPEFTEEDFDLWLRHLTRSKRYLRALAVGEMRRASCLDGGIAGKVDPKHRRFAGRLLEQKKRRSRHEPPPRGQKRAPGARAGVLRAHRFASGNTLAVGKSGFVSVAGTNIGAHDRLV